MGTLGLGRPSTPPPQFTSFPLRGRGFPVCHSRPRPTLALELPRLFPCVFPSSPHHWLSLNTNQSHKSLLSSFCFFTLLSPYCHTCGVCVYGTCCVLPPSTHSVWLFPTTPLFRHCSQPRLHGADPETTSWFLCTWPRTPLVLESLVRMLSPWAPGHHLLPLSLLPVEFASHLNAFLPGVSSLAWHVAPAQTSLQTRQPSCSSVSFLLSPAQTFHGQLNLCPGPWLGSLWPLPFLPDGGGREPCSFVLMDAPFGFVVGSHWPFPAPPLADQG